MAGGALLILLAMTYWGGSAQPGPTFWLGIAVPGGLLLGFGALLWWVFQSPLPGDARVEAKPNPALRQLVAYVAAAGGVIFLAGVLWDAAWQQLYGAVIGDFWWRPHLLIYGSMGLNAVLALGALWVKARDAGGLRARFRRDPLVGLLGLLSLFMLVSAPSGLLWRQAAGQNFTAWSLPHLMTGIGFLLVMLVAVAVQTSVLPRQQGWDVHRLAMDELNVLVLLAVTASVLLLIGVAEWDHLLGIAPGTADAGRIPAPFWARPAWLYPTIILGVVLFVAPIALHVLRRPGAAVLVFAAVLFMRAITNFLFQRFFGVVDASATAQFLALIPAAAMDAVYVYRMYEADDESTTWLALGAGLVAMLAGGLLLMSRLVTYPPVDAGTLPGMLLMGAIAGLFCGWCGASIGRYIARGRAVTQPPADQIARITTAGASAYVILLAVAVFLMVTATPPN